MRAAPIIGSGIGLLSTVLSKPDYSYPNTLQEESLKAKKRNPVFFNPIDGYIKPDLISREYIANRLKAESAAARNAALSVSRGNKAMALQALADVDRRVEQSQVDAIIQAQKYNAAQKQAAAEFKRDVDKFNAEGLYSSLMANAQLDLEANKTYLDGLYKSMLMRQSIDDARASAISAGLTGLFDNIGALGEDIANRRDVQMLIDSGALKGS